jgi:exopolysaccharide production protein ExoY
LDVVLLQRADSRIGYDVAKRLVDILLAIVGLVLGLVLIVPAAVLVKLTSPGPAFYPHPRCGRDGRTFNCWKIRTMIADAERILDEDPRLQAAYAERYKLAGDPRVTAIGGFLRRFSLDELPQFWNVLRGEMSLVGPRPVTMSELVDMYGEAASMVTSVRPGLTGLWQVSGRSALTRAERVMLDREYVDQRSLLLDMRVLLRTPAAVLAARGAC